MAVLGLSDIHLWGVLPALIYYIFFYKSRRDKMLEKFKGPPRLPIIGHTFDFVLTPKEKLFPMLMKWCEEYPILKTYSGSRRFLVLTDPKHVEKLLTSTVHIKKGHSYNFLRPWLGDGLLISNGSKWSHRRKMLTPAFHFKILEDFLPIFNKESLKMVRIIKEQKNQGFFDIVPVLTNCTLDIICETAMGKALHAQDGQNTEYTQATKEFAEVMQTRSFRPWLHNDWIYKHSALGKRQKELLEILHGFTDTVIRERKAQRKNAKKAESNETIAKVKEEDDIHFGKAKKRIAFLDLVLETQEEVGDSQLTDQDIREETDTFMFAGHDTTSVGITYTLYALGAYPEVQAKLREELESVFGDDKDRPVTPDDIAKLKYLDCVIKESLRVYSSVPWIQRYLTSDLHLEDDLVIPADVTVNLFIYHIHKNPKYFPEPFQFKPERWMDGQKFALMEEKTLISNMLRNFKIESKQKAEDLVITGAITLSSPDGIHLKLTPV